MAISIGDRLPDAVFTQFTGQDVKTAETPDLLAGQTVAMFGLPGAFTRTCSAAHLPGFMDVAEQLKAKGVDRVICLSVNDPFVMHAWDLATGASKAGVEMWVDADGSFTKAIGLDFDAPPMGFIGRSKRYSALIEDGVVTILNVEVKPGVCELSSGEALLDQI